MSWPRLDHDFTLGKDQSALSVARGSLPFQPPVIGDCSDVAIPLIGWSDTFCRRAPRRNDNSCGSAVLKDGTVGGAAIIGSVRGALTDLSVDLIKQRLHLRGIAGVLIGQPVGDDLTVISVQGQMQLAPGTPRSGAMLVFQPFAGPEHFQTGVVDQYVQRAILWMALLVGLRCPCLPPCGSASYDREQADQGPSDRAARASALRFAAGEARTRSPASGPSRWQGRNSGAGHRGSFAAAPAIRPMLLTSPTGPSCRVGAAPLRNAGQFVTFVFHLRYSVTAAGVVFERHQAKIVSVAVSPHYRQILKTDPCTNALAQSSGCARTAVCQR